MVLIGHVLAVAVAAALHVAPVSAAADPGPEATPAPELRMAAATAPPLRILTQLAQAKQPPNDGFEPISELPPDERLPAAPMLVAAYAFVAVAIFVYLLSISRRLGSIKQEMTRLDAEVRRSGRA